MSARSGGVYRVCACRDPLTKKLLGKDCPKLASYAKGHGSWAFVVDLGQVDGKRKQIRRSGYPTQAAAISDRDTYRQKVADGVRIDEQLTVAAWLNRWLDDKDSDSTQHTYGAIRKSTAVNYRHQVNTYLVPTIGDIKLAKLTRQDVTNALRRIEADAAAKRLLNPKAKCAGPTTLRRVRACLSSALNAAVDDGLIQRNVAQAKRGDNAKATDTSHAAQFTMWEVSQMAAFLQSIQDEQLRMLFEFMLASGVRRGEALGLRWCDLDLSSGQVSIKRQLLNRWENGQPVFGPPKSAAGTRTFNLSQHTTQRLRGYRDRMHPDEPARLPGAPADERLVFCQATGAAFDPSAITKQFTTLVAAAGLPPTRLHDLRHFAASMMLDAGINPKVVQVRLGHSSIRTTLEIYGHLMPKADTKAAEVAWAPLETALTETAA